MEEKLVPEKIPLLSIEDAVLAAKLILNPEEIRAKQDRFDEEARGVSQRFLRETEFTI